MSNYSLELHGFNRLREEFIDEIDDWSDSETIHVGTAVEYAVYVEFATSKMDARPYFRPAVTEARRDMSEFVADNSGTTIRQIDSAEELVETIGLALERRVKEIITRKGIIDTGTLRASIRAVDAQSELVAADEVKV